MLRLIFIVLLFLVSLLVLFRPPFHFAWFASVAVAAYTWMFIVAGLVLFSWSLYAKNYKSVSLFLSAIAVILCVSVFVRSYSIGKTLDSRIQSAYGLQPNTIQGFHQPTPFSLGTIFSGNGTHKIEPVIRKYATKDGMDLSLKFYPSAVAGLRPCLVVVHGGAWHSGSYDELPEADNYYANAGYQVASINYRLAPQFKSPAPLEDVRSAIAWLTAHAAGLNIDTTNYLLMGRSAGGQIVLAAAYTLHNPNIKGVAGYYGPTDMVWSYNNPDNPLVLDSKKVVVDYMGGMPEQLPDNYHSVSPMDNVTAATVPTLLVTGENDAHVWPAQQDRLATIFNKYHVPNMILKIPWASHGCEYNLRSTSGQLCTYTTERFFYAVTHPAAK